MEFRNLQDDLKGLIDLERELSTLTGNDDQTVPAYWVRSSNAFSTALSRKIAEEYDNVNHVNNQQYPDKRTPHELRFPNIKKQIVEIYETFEDELSQEFMITQENGKKKLNDSWIRIRKEISEDEFCKEDEDLSRSIRSNQGLRIIIKEYTPEEIKKGKVNMELPISELYRACLYLDKNGIKQPRYPYVFINLIYHCFKHTIPEDKLSPRILQVLLDIQERKETLLMKEKNKLGSTMESVKKSIAPFISSNKEQFSGLTSQINSQLTNLTDDSIDEVAEQCHKAIETFTSNENKDLSQIIGDMLSTDADKVKETMEQVGLGEENIKALVGNVSDGLPNDELKATIPTFDDIDAIINGNSSK